MLTVPDLRSLPFDAALTAVERGAAFVDLRAAGDYLDVHIPGSLCLVYEWGPGMAARARDCLPLDLPLIVMDTGGDADYGHAAASLRGKGFTVPGRVTDPINEWADRRGALASTEVIRSPVPGTGTALDVGDFGAEPIEDSVRIPIEQLWARVGELAEAKRVAVIGGYGVRAALAVGILERAGAEEILFWKGRGGSSP